MDIRAEEEEGIKFRFKEMELLCIGQKWGNAKLNTTTASDKNKTGIFILGYVGTIEMLSLNEDLGPFS